MSSIREMREFEIARANESRHYCAMVRQAMIDSGTPVEEADRRYIEANNKANAHHLEKMEQIAIESMKRALTGIILVVFGVAVCVILSVVF